MVVQATPSGEVSPFPAEPRAEKIPSDFDHALHRRLPNGSVTGLDQVLPSLETLENPFTVVLEIRLNIASQNRFEETVAIRTCIAELISLSKSSVVEHFYAEYSGNRQLGSAGTPKCAIVQRHGRQNTK